jgi:glycosyltransferase involved in cell wall biosynthesis
MRVTFFTARYSHSGVPLAQIRLANLFLERGYEIDFIVGYIPNGLIFPELAGINTIIFNQPRVFKMVPKIIKYLYTRKPDVVISAEDHLNAIVLLSAIITRSKAKISVSSRVTPFDTYSDKILTKRWFLKYFMIAVQRRATALVCVSKDMIEQYQKIFKSTRHQCIYNVVKDRHSQNKMDEAIDEPWLTKKTCPVIVTAGRLAPEKGYPDLILAVKEVSKTREIRLIMLGDGPMRDELETLIEQQELSEIVKLVGFQSNPLKYYKRADVFVLSSYVEGLPNVLVEAMMCGCTPVSTNCPTGPREVLQNEQYGYIVPMRDPLNMARGIEKALDAPIDKTKLKEGVFEFTEEKVFSRYVEALNL